MAPAFLKTWRFLVFKQRRSHIIVGKRFLMHMSGIIQATVVHGSTSFLEYIEEYEQR